MSGAPVIELADAVAAGLAADAGSFSPFATPERAYIPRVDMRVGPAELRVVVWPRSVETAVISRKAVRDVLQVDVGILKRLSNADDAADAEEVNGLMALAADVARWSERRPLDGSDAEWQGASIPQLYAPDKLNESKLFQSVITLTYGLTRGA